MPRIAVATSRIAMGVNTPQRIFLLFIIDSGGLSIMGDHPNA